MKTYPVKLVGVLLMGTAALFPQGAAQNPGAEMKTLFDDSFSDCYGSFPSSRWDLLSGYAKCLGGSCGPQTESCLNVQYENAQGRVQHRFTTDSSKLSLAVSFRDRSPDSASMDRIGIWDYGDGSPTWWVGADLRPVSREMYALDGTFLGVWASSGYTTVTFEWDRASNTYDVKVGSALAASAVPASAANPTSAKAIALQAASQDHMLEIDGVTLKHLVNPPPPNQSPVASFSYSPGQDYSTRRKITFDAGGSYDPDGSLAKYSWSFGDGQTFETTSSSVWHNYGADGEYSVTLTVKDDKGATGSVTKSVRVNLPPPSSSPVPSPTRAVCRSDDSDCDGVPDSTDNCPTNGNNQADSDGDGVGDACDSTPYGDPSSPSPSHATSSVGAMAACLAIASVTLARRPWKRATRIRGVPEPWGSRRS